jgi:hypothetical protein
MKCNPIKLLFWGKTLTWKVLKFYENRVLHAVAIGLRKEMDVRCVNAGLNKGWRGYGSTLWWFPRSRISKGHVPCKWRWHECSDSEIEGARRWKLEKVVSELLLPKPGGMCYRHNLARPNGGPWARWAQKINVINLWIGSCVGVCRAESAMHLVY